jgi:beta-phosphoglucomutase-like phosphatase (HAD superfamily)
MHLVAGAPTLKVIEEIAGVARRAHGRRQPLAIGSNSTAITLDAGMRATGLASLFRAAICWNDVARGRGKPAPDIFLLAAERLGVDPGRCLVFEDTDEGIAAALAAGMDSYNVRTRMLRSPPRRR